MIVGTTLTKLFAIMIALNTCSSAMTLVGVFLVLGSVMETRIALMALMKMTKFAVSTDLNSICVIKLMNNFMIFCRT